MCKLINSKQQPPSLKKLLTKVEFSNEEVGDLRCECCEPLLLSKEYTFKNVNKTLTLKTLMSCNSFNVIYDLICSGGLEEYIGEMGIGETRLRDRVRVYRQHIKLPVHQKLKVEEHILICGKDSFKIFLFLQMRSNDTNLRRAYETKFQRECKTKLNELSQIKCMTQRFSVSTIAFKNTPARDHHFLIPFYIVTKRKCPCLTPQKVTGISSFSTAQASLKLAIKCDVKF